MGHMQAVTLSDVAVADRSRVRHVDDPRPVLATPSTPAEPISPELALVCAELRASAIAALPHIEPWEAVVTRRVFDAPHLKPLDAAVESSTPRQAVFRVLGLPLLTAAVAICTTGVLTAIADAIR
jgi:hypothetical protein